MLTFAVLPVDQGLGKEQYSKSKKRRNITKGQWKRSVDYCFPWQLMLTITELWLHTTFSLSHILVMCLGAQSIKLWDTSAESDLHFSYFMQSLLPLFYRDCFASLRSSLAASSHQIHPLLSSCRMTMPSYCLSFRIYFSCLLLSVNPYTLFPV